MLLTGLLYMIVGMVVVFIFLGLLVLVLQVAASMLRRLAKWLPEKEEVKSRGEAAEDVAIALAAINYREAQKDER
jgi:sodium pump decarboxylase gamma subunit